MNHKLLSIFTGVVDLIIVDSKRPLNVVHFILLLFLLHKQSLDTVMRLLIVDLLTVWILFNLAVGADLFVILAQFQVAFDVLDVELFTASQRTVLLSKLTSLLMLKCILICKSKFEEINFLFVF